MPFRTQLHKDVSKKDVSKFADVLSFIFRYTYLLLCQHRHKSHLNAIAVCVRFMELAKVFIIFMQCPACVVVFQLAACKSLREVHWAWRVFCRHGRND